MNILKKNIVIIFIISLLTFLFVDVFPCHGLNYLFLTNNNNYNNKMYNEISKSSSFYKQKYNEKTNLPIACFRAKNQLTSKNTICFAKESVNSDKFNNDDSTILKLVEKTGNFYDVVILSDPELPKTIKTKVESNIVHYKKYLSAIVDSKIKDSNKISDAVKKEIIEIHKNLGKVDLDNPKAVEARFKKAINSLAQKSLLGYYTKGLESVQNQLIKEEIQIINKTLKEKGFKRDQKVFFSVDHLFEQRNSENFDFMQGSNSEVNETSSGSHKKNLSDSSSSSIPLKLIQNPINKKGIPDSLHDVKNFIDHYQWGKTEKNPTKPIKKMINRIDELRMNWGNKPKKIKYSKKLKKMIVEYNKNYKKWKKQSRRS